MSNKVVLFSYHWQWNIDGEAILISSRIFFLFIHKFSDYFKRSHLILLPCLNFNLPSSNANHFSFVYKMSDIYLFDLTTYRTCRVINWTNFTVDLSEKRGTIQRKKDEEIAADQWTIRMQVFSNQGMILCRHGS